MIGEREPQGARARLYVALDHASLREALALVERLGGLVDGYKIGLELFAAVGPSAVAEVRSRGGRVFLDLKLHDIPETVRRAARAVAALGVETMTVHAAGGPAMLEAAVRGAAEGGAASVLAVTVLTSMDERDLRAVGTEVASVEELVVRRALLARAAGCGGVVASPREARALRIAAGLAFDIVTPGVRPSGAAADDQKRVATVRQAIADGASHLVIGRPIRDAPDPRAAAEAILAEIAGS